MSHTLYCDFALNSKRGSAYWWPLIFEVMRQYSFQFSSPALSHGKGRYFYVRHNSPNSQDTNSVVGTLKNLWDEIFLESSDVTVSFWSRGNEPFLLEVLVSQQNTDTPIHVFLMLEGAEAMEIPPEEIRERLCLVLDCAKTLYKVCQPCTGEMYWIYAGDRYAPWASFGKALERSSSNLPEHRGPEKTLVEQVLPGAGRMYLLDPVPIPKGTEWDFISLLE